MNFLKQAIKVVAVTAMIMITTVGCGILKKKEYHKEKSEITVERAETVTTTTQAHEVQTGDVKAVIIGRVSISPDGTISGDSAIVVGAYRKEREEKAVEKKDIEEKTEQTELTIDKKSEPDKGSLLELVIWVVGIVSAIYLMIRLYRFLASGGILK